MKAYGVKWSDGLSVCFADNLEEAANKFDALGQPLKIYELDLSNLIIDEINFKGDGKIEARIEKLSYCEKLFKKLYSYKQTWNALKRSYK